MASLEQAIVPLDSADGLHDLVSMFSQMKITKRRNNISDSSDSDDEGESIYINGEKVVSYVTFHKYIPNIIASLANGKTITIMDNRLREDVGPELHKETLSPVPYRSDPFSRLCDENTVISYDKVNHIIKLWDLRKNYTNYNKQPNPKSIIYLSKTNLKTSHSTPLNKQSSLVEIKEELVKNSSIPSAETSQKYSLDYVLTWPDSLPSVVVTYPDNKPTRKGSVVIEELPDDWEDPIAKKREILPLIYKQNNLKRKHSEPRDDINVCKKSVSTCLRCNKATVAAVFCDSCNWTDSKRKSTDDLQHETKRLQTSNGYTRIFSDNPASSSSANLKMKRKIENDDVVQDFSCKRIHLESRIMPEKHPDTSTNKVTEPKRNTIYSFSCDLGSRSETVEGNDTNSKIVNLPEYMLDSLLLNSIFTTEKLDWKSKLRKENCDPKPAKMPKVIA